MSEQSAIKIVVDTNIWVSFLIGKRLAHLKNLIIAGRVEVYFSDELYHEIIKVLEHPRLNKYIALNDFFELINLFKKKIHFVKPALQSAVFDCRDPKDNFLLELAVSVKADYLITGDKDLLILNPCHGVAIVNPREFETFLKKTEQ